MADTRAEELAPSQALPAKPDTASSADGTPGRYPMSREGRRQAIVLLLGVLSIEVFAIWSLITMVGDGLSGIDWVSVPLMLAIVLVAPLVAWTLLEEANAVVLADDKGLTYRTLGGIDLRYDWSEITGFKEKDRRGKLARFFLGDDDEAKLAARDDASRPSAEDAEGARGDEEPETVLLSLSKDPATRIGNPVVRFLHRQAHGDALPVHGGLENRAALLQEIHSHLTGD